MHSLKWFFNRPMFDFTSQYIVKVDDFFLHYLQKVNLICIMYISHENRCVGGYEFLLTVLRGDGGVIAALTV